MADALIESAKLALNTFHKLKDSRTTYDQFSSDVGCLLISVGSLEREPTRQLIDEYLASDIDGTRQNEVDALTQGLQSVTEPFVRLLNVSASAFGPPDKHVKATDVNSWLDSWIHLTARGTFAFQVDKLSEVWSKFSLQAAHLNTFMTRLIHMQLQRQTELLSLRLAEQSLLKDNWRYTADLANGTEQFRQDIARYIEYLCKDGRPFTEHELAERKRAIHHDDLESGPASPDNYKRDTYRRSQSDAGLAYNVKHRREDDTRTPTPNNDHHLSVNAEDPRSQSRSPNRSRSTRERSPLKLETPAIEVNDPLSRIRSSPGPAAYQFESVHHQQQRRPSHSTHRQIPACENCDREIPNTTTCYRCSSGRCRGSKAEDYIVCSSCYERGRRCPGRDDPKDYCGRMERLGAARSRGRSEGRYE